MLKLFAPVAAWVCLSAVCAAQSDPKIALDPASPSTASGVSSADVLRPGPSIATPASSLGLTPGFDFLNDISYGRDGLLGPVFFTVDRTAVGLAGTDVFTESILNNAGSDIFRALPSGSAALNSLAIRGPMLGLIPGLFGDQLTALATGDPTPFTYFALNAGSASIGPGGASNIYVSSGGGGFTIFAAGSSMNLDSTDQIDALALFDVNHNGMADLGDFALYSLTSFSTSTFTTSGASYVPGLKGALSPSDIMLTTFNGSSSLYASAATLGLRDDDELTAIHLGSVPEPSSFALLAVGAVGGLLIRARRKRRVPG